jgi:hypothetical protein
MSFDFKVVQSFGEPQQQSFANSLKNGTKEQKVLEVLVNQDAPLSKVRGLRLSTWGPQKTNLNHRKFSLTLLVTWE